IEKGAPVSGAPFEMTNCKRAGASPEKVGNAYAETSAAVHQRQNELLDIAVIAHLYPVESTPLSALNVHHISDFLDQNLADFLAFRIVRNRQTNGAAHDLARHVLGMVAVHKLML